MRFTHGIVQEALRDWRKMPVYPDLSFPPSSYYRVLGTMVRNASVRDPGLIVELGTDGGGASLYMALACPNNAVHSFDVTRTSTVQIVERLCANFHFRQLDSCDASAVFGAGAVGLLFVDTTHTYEQTMKEFRAWRSKMAPGGIIALDDVGREGMDRAVAEIGGDQIAVPEHGGDGGMVFVFVGEQR